MKNNFRAKFGFVWVIFLIGPLKQGFWDLNGAVVTLQYKDLIVKNH